MKVRRYIPGRQGGSDGQQEDMISRRRSKVKLKSIKQQSIVRELQIVWHYWSLRYGIERERGGIYRN